MIQLQIARWGNSSAIRLPKAVMEELKLSPGQTVELTVENGRAVIEPARPQKITLEWIIAETIRLGPENMPETVEWGPDIGSEIIDDEYSRGEIVIEDEDS